MTVRAQTGWTRTEILDRVTEAVPGARLVSVREDAFHAVFEVRLFAPWWRGAGWRDRMVARAHAAVASAPAGVRITVGWR